MKINLSDCQLELIPESAGERRDLEKKTNLAMRRFGVSSRVGRIFAAVTICSELRDDIAVDLKRVYYQDKSFSIYPKGLDGTSYPEVSVCP